VKRSGQERRAIGKGGIYIGLSQETSHWAKIQILDNVRQDRTKAGRGSLWIGEDVPGRARLCPTKACCFG
jgi:hypothetical protein